MYMIYMNTNLLWNIKQKTLNPLARPYTERGTRHSPTHNRGGIDPRARIYSYRGNLIVVSYNVYVVSKNVVMF